MLDFYLINDDQATPGSPEQLNLTFVGGLDSQTFENLVKKIVIDARFDYYSDFRWSSAIVQELRTKTVKLGHQGEADIQQLIRLLDSGLKQNSGLIAFCD